ncbi:MAG: hypothetical protein GY705_05545, partial [Bacteroidetes bacterium]|nr:hypothetical protein [Bacteroidota bacterium]
MKNNLLSIQLSKFFTLGAIVLFLLSVQEADAQIALENPFCKGEDVYTCLSRRVDFADLIMEVTIIESDRIVDKEQFNNKFPFFYLFFFLWHPVRKRFTSLKRLSTFSASHHCVQVKKPRR